MRAPPRSSPFPYTTLFRSPLLVDRPSVLEPVVEELANPRGECRRARLGGPGARHLARVVPQRLAVSRPDRHPTQTADEGAVRSEEHTSELQSLRHLVCRLL